MTKLVLDDIGSTLTNTAATTINNNNTKIEQALENTLSRDGSTPNNMQADLDMDSNDVLNVANLDADTITLNGSVLVPGGVTEIPPESITTAMLGPNSVTNSKIADGAVSETKLATNAVTTTKIANGVVTRDKSANWKHSVIINVKEYGAVGDGVVDDTTAFQSAITASTATGLDIWVPVGTYRLTTTLILPDGVKMIGEGRGFEFSNRTKLIFSGTGTKSYTMAGATSITIANPSAGEAYLADSGTRGDNYRTLDLSLAFSAAIILGKASSLENLGIYPNLNGVAGYVTALNGDMSDDWDVGVWARNSDSWSILDCNVMGHWRKSALLVSAHDIGDSLTPSNEKGYAARCRFQGFRGVAIRCPEVVVGSNFGFAGTIFDSCDFRPLQHQSQHLATSSFLNTPFSSPSGCLEFAGDDDNLRGIKFYNVTLIGRDDICIIATGGSEMMFSGCYLEAQNIRLSGGGFMTNGAGSRMVANANPAAYLFDELTAKFRVDFSPYQVRDSSLTGQRYTALGVWNPSQADDKDYSEMRFSSKYGPRLRTATQAFAIDGVDGSGSITEMYRMTGAGHHEQKLTYTGTVTIADDAAASIPTPKNGGFVAITCCGSTENGNFPDPLRSGIVFYDVGTAAFTATKFSAAAANFVAVNTDVIGTTGTDGNVTVGVILSNIRIENRAGSSQVFRYFFFG